METKVSIGLLLVGALLLTSLISGTSDGSEPRMRTDLSWSSASFIGEDTLDNAGYSVDYAGDVNGDGYDDILIGAKGDDDGGSGAGQVYLILGRGSTWPMNTDLSNANASFWGEDAGDEAGHSVSGAGDVNSDGYDDFLIGAHGDDDGGSQAGQVYLIFGKATGWVMDTDLSTASASFWGEDAGDQAGYQVSGAGDVNDDGYSDILIGASSDDDGGSDAGQIYLILGKRTGWAMDTDLSGASASFWGENANDYTTKISGAGDVNGDGYDDFLVGCDYSDTSTTNSGQVYVILGKASGWAMDTDLSAVSASFWGESTSDQLGFSVSGAGDVNGDGFDDILAGAIGDDDGGNSAGQSYLILGHDSGWAMDTPLSSASASFWGENADDYSGFSVSEGGDFNNDGYGDFLIGAYENSYGGSAAGQTYMITGKASGWYMDTDLSRATASFLGEDSSDRSGCSISGAGDANGDGYSDIIIGARDDEDGGNFAGQVYLLLSNADPPGPRDLEAVNSADNAQVDLTWTGPLAWAEPLECYRIYRSLDGSNYDYLGSTKNSVRTYTDTAVSIGLDYHYLVATDFGQGEDWQGKAKVSIVCDMDPDLDGIGNMADWDDDDDKVADQSDAFPLDSKEWLDTDQDGVGNNADADDDNDGIGDPEDPEPLNPLNGVQLDLATMHTDLIQTRDEITLLLEGIGFDLADINDTLIQRIDELDLKISAQLYQLRELIESVNESIQVRLFQLGTDLTSFKSDMVDELSGISASLDADQAELIGEIGSISDQIDSLSISLEGVNVSMLDSIGSGLAGISNELTKGDENLSTEIEFLIDRLNEYRDDTAKDLHNISDLMATMQELQSLSDTADRIETDLDALNGLQTGVDDIQKEQEKTGSDISLNTVLLIAAIFLQVLLLIIGAVLLLRRRDGSDGFQPE